MIDHTGISDCGSRRSVNEDSMGWNVARGLYFVADGMGGHAGGATASALVQRTLLQAQAPTLLALVRSAHERIVERARCERALAGMGSTVVAMQVHGARAELVWAGDSRAYLWRAGTLSQLTRDHSLVQSLVERGRMPASVAQCHPQKNILTQVLGGNAVNPEQARLQLRHDDWVLLCSDGLTDKLSDSEIASVLRRSCSIEIAQDALLTAALARSADDNVTVLLVRYTRYNAKAALAAGLTAGLSAIGALTLFGIGWLAQL
ncbi:MAG: protein phosphatase 2C domain-containing protein [Pseudomonadota bacterium]